MEKSTTNSSIRQITINKVKELMKNGTPNIEIEKVLIEANIPGHEWPDIYFNLQRSIAFNP